MPLLKLTTSVPPSPAQAALLTGLSKFIAEQLEKPEGYVMTALERPVAMTFAGTTEPCCYVELRNIGRFRPEDTRKLSAELCERLSIGLGIPKNRIFIEFGDAEGHLWGHNGDTFD